MVPKQSILSIPVIWREKKFVLEMNPEASLRELGDELQTLTDVKADTMRLIIPQSSAKSSKLMLPFSDEHSSCRLQDAGITEGKPLRMMGASEHEVEQVLKDAKANLRIVGFEEEEKRMKQRISRGPQVSLKLPQGPYVFCDFRTLELPGIELNPPPSEALKRMHMLAADPGIVAVMNKHRWRVGIMTEMAPVGYVGISPKCLLGLNKNRGEEISLRLRTDDLKGFRKYESMKEVLLHELAHMVYTEHDVNFYALNKQLNQEASALDWRRSRSHSLADTPFVGHDDMDMDYESETSVPHKLGGETSRMASSARAASVAAAYHRLTNSSAVPHESTAHGEQDPGDCRSETHENYKPVGPMGKADPVIGNQCDNWSLNQDKLEPDPDDSEAGETMNLEPYSEVNEGITAVKLNLDDNEMTEAVSNLHKELDPDGLEVPDSRVTAETGISDSLMQIENNAERTTRNKEEPDPDDFEASRGDQSQVIKVHVEPDPDDSQENKICQARPDPDDKFEDVPQVLDVTKDEPDPDDEALRTIQDPVNVFCKRLTKAIETLRAEIGPLNAMEALGTLFKVIKNVSENPNEIKYKRLRKANPVFQRRVANHKAAMEVLFLIGFSEDVVINETGNAETYLVLKRNDPGLLWLAKSTLETWIS